MRESSETDATGESEWGASDALLLEGLSGLDQQFARTPKEDTDSRANGSGDEPSDETAQSAHRSARELRAEQERMAAIQRSAVRRREGVTQALGLTPSQEQRAQEVEVAPKPVPERVSLREQIEPSQPPAEARLVAAAPPVESVEPAIQKKEVEVLRKREVEAKEEPTPTRSEPTLPPSVPLVTEPREPGRELGTRPEDAGSSVRERMVTPQMEPTVRRRRTSSSFLPSVLTSLLLTTLVWGAVLYAAWKFVGEEWFNNRVQEAAGSLENGEDDQQVVSKLRQEVQTLDEELKLFRASNQSYVRMNTLVASIYLEHSRQKYDELVDIGEPLDSSSPEKEYYLRTKERIDNSFIKRAFQIQELNTRQLFPNLGVTKDVYLSKTTLAKFVSNQEGDGEQRARAALLLRKFKGDGEVMKQLRQTVRDDHDLRVYCAAWDSLVDLTGYDPGSRGVQPDDFDHWWSNRGQ